MLTDKGLVDFCYSKLGTPYVFGMKGTKLTEDDLKRLRQECPKQHTEGYQNMARQFLGMNCTDCSGLISWYTKIMRGSSNYCDTAVDKKPISALNDSMIGWALWKSGHIGVYVGGGYCIEAKGIKYGTVKSKVSDNKSWQYALKLKDIQYGEAAGAQVPPSKTTQTPVITTISEPVIEVPPKIGWEKVNDRWKYRQSDGTYIVNDWLQDPASKDWYWFDGAGNAIKNDWYLYNNKWYYFNNECKMVVGYQKIKGKDYYFTESGEMSRKGFPATLQHIVENFLKSKK